MMDFKTVILSCLTVSVMSGEIHHPKVYEDDAEYNNENIRTARNSESPYRTIHQSPIFNFKATKQQDYLKSRYAEQQKANSGSVINKMNTNHKYRSQNMYKQNEKAVRDTNDWEPFNPKVYNLNIQGNSHLKSTKDIKYYKPNYIKTDLYQKTQDKAAFLERLSNFTSKENEDMVAAGSEIDEKTVDKRTDSLDDYEKVVYLHPDQLQHALRHNSGENQGTIANPDINIKQPAMGLTALHDLIGKNPNVQLEGLKRLLQETSSKEYNLPLIQRPESFQNTGHTSVPEKAVPNPLIGASIQLNHIDNTISLQTPQLIDKDSFENIQKQLDEASKIQAQQVIARAQQEAQAHVEAQHKAIVLAQVEAQKTALENIQKSLFVSPQALPLVRHPQSGEYQTSVNQAPQPSTNALHLSTNNDISISQENIVQNPDLVEQHTTNSLRNNILLQKPVAQLSTQNYIADIPSAPKSPTALYKDLRPQSYGSKEVLYYAPNHHHDVTTQLQAQGSHLSQIPVQNNIFNERKPSAITQILKTEEVSSAETEDASNIHTVTHIEPKATAYQHVLLESKEIENSAAEQKDYDDLDEYAAKYAFGYRIKDIKEGNDFGHEERRNGKNLEGSYHVLLPDGRLQKVEYYADNSGYHAKVTYEHLSQS